LPPAILKLARNGVYEYSSSANSRAYSAVTGVSRARNLFKKKKSIKSPLLATTSSSFSGIGGEGGGGDDLSTILMSNRSQQSQTLSLSQSKKTSKSKLSKKDKYHDKNKVLVLNLDLSYSTKTVWISNKILLMSVYQPLLSDALDLVAHQPLTCQGFHLQLDPEALEELLPPMLKVKTFLSSLKVSYSDTSLPSPMASPQLKPFSSSSSSSSSKTNNNKLKRNKSISSIPSLKSLKSMKEMSGLSIRLDDEEDDDGGNPISKSGRVKKKVSTTPGANPTSLAFVGSRPSLAKHLLKHASELLELRAIPGVIGHGQLSLKNDPGGDRARLAKIEFEKKKILMLQLIENQKIRKEINLRLLCRQYQLDKYRILLSQTRRNDLYEIDMKAQSIENELMSIEDEGSEAARSYLACPWTEVQALEGAFKDMDNDGSGALDANEFQDLMFALGIELSDEDAEKEVATIDLDGNGVVDFFEFALWWLTNAERLGMQSETLSGANTSTRIKLKMSMEQRRIRRRLTDSISGNNSKLATVDAATEVANARAEGDTHSFAVHTARLNRKTLTRLPRKSATPAKPSAELL